MNTWQNFKLAKFNRRQVTNTYKLYITYQYYVVIHPSFTLLYNMSMSDFHISWSQASDLTTQQIEHITKKNSSIALVGRTTKSQTVGNTDNIHQYSVIVIDNHDNGKKI